jgi:hypothetical protein
VPVLLLGIVGGMGSLLYSLSDDATALIGPAKRRKLRLTLRGPQAPPGTIDSVRRRLENSSEPPGGRAPAAPDPVA